MRKIRLLVSLLLLTLALLGCEQQRPHVHAFVWHSDENGHSSQCACGTISEEASAHTDSQPDGYCDVCNYPLAVPIDLPEMFITAYANAFPQEMQIDRNNIQVTEYYGMIGDAHIVSMDSSYLDEAYPNGVYIESVEGMQFRYDRSYKVYIIYNETLFSAKAAYENKIIDFNSLCKIFGLHTAKLSTFNAEAYRAIKATLESQCNDADRYELGRYYGEFNGFYAISLNFLGGQAAVCFEENVNHLYFEYGYQSNRIRFMNGMESYTLNAAFERGIITQADLYNLFEIRTKSQTIDEALVTQLLTPAYELCLKYKDDFNREVVFERFYLSKYYGQYGDCHIYALRSSCYLSGHTSATAEEREVIGIGFSDIAYVLNDGKLYTLEQALDQGIITQEIYDEILDKYYE